MGAEPRPPGTEAAPPPAAPSSRAPHPATTAGSMGPRWLRIQVCQGARAKCRVSTPGTRCTKVSENMHFKSEKTLRLLNTHVFVGVAICHSENF